MILFSLTFYLAGFNIKIHEMKEICFMKTVWKKESFNFWLYILKFCTKSHKNSLNCKFYTKFHATENSIKMHAIIFVWCYNNGQTNLQFYTINNNYIWNLCFCRLSSQHMRMWISKRVWSRKPNFEKSHKTLTVFHWFSL